MTLVPEYHLAYVFERFPTFTQTFCIREIKELRRAGVRPLIFSIRDTRDEDFCAGFEDLRGLVHVLPAEKELVETVKAWKDDRRFPQEVVLTLRHWGDRPDKMRAYEAAYIGLKMREAGVRHTHAHFAGIAARTSWWIRRFYDFTYSVTGHANDLFCEPANTTPTLETLLKDMSVAVTVSDYTAGWLRQNYPSEAGKVRRVYNGLDLAPFTEMAGNRSLAPTSPETPLQILSVGRLIEKKGCDDLITACGILKDSGQNFRCRIVGDGPLKGQLESQIRAAGLEDKVELTGPKTFGDVLALLGEADVFALACVTEKDGGKDNLPTVIMEAMAAGLPCVSTRLAGVPEMVVEGETGLLVDERNPEAFAAALRTLINDPPGRFAMGQAGVRHALSLFDKEVTTKSLLCYLVAGGLVNTDPALVAECRDLASCYRAQRLKRLLRFFRVGRNPKAGVVGGANR